MAKLDVVPKKKKNYANFGNTKNNIKSNKSK